MAVRGTPPPGDGSFGAFVARARARGELVVQPRMGFGGPEQMRAGLLATMGARATTVGTITLDSYTRVGDRAGARRALARAEDLNGYPIVTHSRAATRRMLAGVVGAPFPVQVRHGSARPQAIFTAMRSAGLHATEGGPVSYCLPYSRAPIEQSVRSWAACCRMLARTGGPTPHLETFGGCLLGQMCPPGLLVATSLLEALFFRQHGLESVSLSYAQHTHHMQDVEAVTALRRLAREFLGDLDWHVVVYAYMGLYPRTRGGALALLDEAVALAVRTGSERLIVKTAAEAFRIPTIGENVEALERAHRSALAHRDRVHREPVPDTGVYAEARTLVEAVRGLHRDVGRAMTLAFRRGYLDVPYCLHPDNAGRTSSRLEPDGRLAWSATAGLPIGSGRPPAVTPSPAAAVDLLRALTYVQRKFDGLAGAGDGRTTTPPAGRSRARTTPQEART